MNRIEVITFKGCQSAIELRDELEAWVPKTDIEARIDVRLVHAPESARDQGLYGAPTILIDGVEYQRERRGPPGFY